MKKSFALDEVQKCKNKITLVDKVVNNSSSRASRKLDQFIKS